MLKGKCMRTSARIWGIFSDYQKKKKVPGKKLGNASKNTLAIRDNQRCCKQLVASLGIWEICIIIK
jgi:hypothetical protein